MGGRAVGDHGEGVEFFTQYCGHVSTTDFPYWAGMYAGAENIALTPFFPLKDNTPTRVFMDSPMSSKADSMACEPSLIWDMNRLKSSKPPTPRFFLIGDSITTTNENMAIP